MPSAEARPPCPCVFSKTERRSATASFHCESPAQICEVCWVPGDAATCRQSSALENVILAKQLCVAQRACMPTNTQQLVAAVRPGLRTMPSGKTKSIGANVELEIGRS